MEKKVNKCRKRFRRLEIVFNIILLQWRSICFENMSIHFKNSGFLSPHLIWCCLYQVNLFKQIKWFEYFSNIYYDIIHKLWFRITTLWITTSPKNRLTRTRDMNKEIKKVNKIKKTPGSLIQHTSGTSSMRQLDCEKCNLKQNLTDLKDHVFHCWRSINHTIIVSERTLFCA